MPIIYLVRHGQASFGSSNYDQLSDNGKRQVSTLGRHWKSRLANFDAVVTGSMHRHKQTAEICLSEMGLESSEIKPVVDAGWNEYDHSDILTQLRPEFATASGIEQYVACQENPKHAFEQLFNEAVARWMDGQFNNDYQETWREFKARVHTSLKTISEQHAGKKQIVVFTSGGPISLLSQFFLGVPEQKLMHLNWTLVNSGVTKLVVTTSRTFVASLSQHVHLEGADSSLLTYR
jgi:broad specificity phosphatase PhoE